VKIRLNQEGFVRTAGFQATQWTSSYPADATTPETYAALFLLRNTEGVESFERVATGTDFVSYPENELKYFEALHGGGGAVFSALPGDTISFDPAIDFWLQADAPYDSCAFEVAAVETVASGGSSAAIAGNQVQLTGYTLTDADVGRWVKLSGFATTGYNVPVQILAYAGSVATVDAAITTNEAGGAWAIRRLRIVTAVDPAQEPRYFPTRVANKPWRLTRGATLVGSGDHGATRRTTEAALFRDRRVTTLEPSLDDALARFAVTRAAVATLQHAAEATDVAFAPRQTYDYP